MDFSRTQMAVLEAMNAPLYICDRQKRLLYINPAAERATGWSASKAAGRKCYEVFGDARQNCPAVCKAEGVMAQGTSTSQEMGRILRRSGDEITVGVSMSPLYEGEEIVGAVVVFEDVTHLDNTLLSLKKEIEEREEVEAALKQSEERYRTLFNNAQIGLFRATIEEGVTLQINQRGAEILGYESPEDCIGKYVAYDHYLKPEDRDHMLAELTAKGVINNFEAALRRRDGSVFWGRSSSRIYPERGYIEGILADITDEKRAAEALRQSRETLLTVLDGIDATLYVADLETDEVLFMNRHMIDSYGGSRVGRPCYEAFRGMSAPCEDCKVRHLKEAEGGSSVVVWEGRNPVTRAWQRRYEKTIPWLDGRPVRLQLGVNIDDLKAAEEGKARLEAQLRHSQKMQALGTLAGGVAHDFNNLLSIISGNVHFLLEDLPADDVKREYAEEVRNAADRAASLTRQLLAFSRRQVIAPKVVNLNDVLAGMRKMLERLLREDVAIELDLCPEPWPVRIDPGQLEQILMNLAANARDSMPRGGTLRIRTRNATVDEAYLRRRIPAGGRPGPYLELVVRDSGQGMDEATLSRVFEPFFTTKEPGRGTGLGLSTVYGIVKQNRGYIWALSEAGQGTTVEILLPRTAGDASKGERAEEEGPAAGTETILLVEDNDSVRAMTRRVLKRHGFRVLEAGGAEAALRTAGEHRGRIDLLVTDVVMPGMNGIDLAKRLQAEEPGLKALFVSGYTDSAVEGYGVPMSQGNFLQKPFSPQTLVRKIRKIIDSGGKS